MKTKILYSITGWKWNGYEYEPQTIFYDEDEGKAREAFDGTHLHLDMPAIELYECRLETEDGISWSMTDKKFLDRRDY